MASKKQINDLENAVIVLEERLEKMEEEHVMLKQMMSMQNSLIDNLQMMVKMMQAPSRVFHVGGMKSGGEIEGNAGNAGNAILASDASNASDASDAILASAGNVEGLSASGGSGNKKKQQLKQRMARVF
jgi:hypothetical protein